VLVVLIIITSLGIGLILSALNVYYRDVQYIVPFLIQLWMYATPIIYPIEMIPIRFRWLYGLNPMVIVIQGFRWALLNTNSTLEISVILSGLISIGLLIIGIIVFRHMEDTFADVI
jgi:lipopolysaccharide transport system permease protein